MNRDGAADLVVANSGADTVTVLTGNGRGGFRALPAVAAMPAPHLLELSDFNSDKHIDAAVSSHDSNQIALLLNNGKGELRRVALVDAFTSPRTHNHGLAAGDVNGDGTADLTFGHQDLDLVAILLGNGRGQFRPAPGSPVPTGRSPYPHALADVDRDGKLDIVVPNVVGGDIRILRGDGRGGFVLQSPVINTGIARPFSVALHDINNDRAVDLVVTHDDTSRIAVLLNDGKGRFRRSASSPVDPGVPSWRIDLADTDADGNADLVLAGGSSIHVLRGDGRGGFSRLLRLPLAGDLWRVLVHDLNSDRRVDLVAPVADGDSVHVLLAR